MSAIVRVRERLRQDIGPKASGHRDERDLRGSGLPPNVGGTGVGYGCNAARAERLGGQARDQPPAGYFVPRSRTPLGMFVSILDSQS
jgi:hypothetical protein